MLRFFRYGSKTVKAQGMKAENEQAIADCLASIRARIRAIGNLSQVSRDSDIPYRTLMKLKSLETDIKVSTLITLCRAIDETPDMVLGFKAPDPARASEAALRAAEARALKAERHVEKAFELLGKMRASPKPPKPQP